MGNYRVQVDRKSKCEISVTKDNNGILRMNSQVVIFLDQNATLSAVERTRWTKASNLFIPEPSALPSLFIDDTFHEPRISTRYAK